jgi:peptidoglycan/LPS O-acetylase OafA/YrhL
MRKHYIDNLRSLVILLLIPYHAAQAWNTWGEPNYLMFGTSRTFSSIIVAFSPFIMPLLFLLAGMSTRFALNKRSAGQYILERVKRLLVPLVFGTLVFVPVMTYLADKYNYGYDGSFFAHYGVFFTKLTDFTGADGGFSFGQFWFLLYLFVISLICLGIILLQKKLIPKAKGNAPLWLVILLGLPLPFIGGLLEVGGKSLVSFAYLFLIGYYVFANDEVVEKIRKYKFIFLAIGLIACIANVYMFIWSGTSFGVLNTAANYVTEWFMILALIGIGKDHIDGNGKAFSYLARISFAFFGLHFIILVVMQYLMAGIFENNRFLLYLVPVIISYVLTFVFSEIFVRIPPLSFLIGVKPRSGNRN